MTRFQQGEWELYSIIRPVDIPNKLNAFWEVITVTLSSCDVRSLLITAVLLQALSEQEAAAGLAPLKAQWEPLDAAACD